MFDFTTATVSKKKEKQEFIEIPYCIQVQNNKIIYRKAYEEFSIKRKEKDKNKDRKLNLKDGKASGLMNRFIAGKMKKIIRNLVEILKMSPFDKQGHKVYMPTFITLTLSDKQQHSDKEIGRVLLMPFIQKLKRKYGVKNYIWRAERQKNGNIHYHIMIDKYVYYERIRDIWNDLQKENGYIDNYKKNKLKSIINEYKIYNINTQKLKHINVKKSQTLSLLNQINSPNSTDIHALQNVENVESYICKYMAKNELNREIEQIRKDISEKESEKEQYIKLLEDKINEQNRQKIDGRIWGCSDEIKELKDPVYIEDSSSIELLMDIVKEKENRVVEHENMIIFYAKNIKNYINKYPNIKKYIVNERKKEYKNLYPKITKTPGCAGQIKPNKSQLGGLKRWLKDGMQLAFPELTRFDNFVY